MRETKIQTIEGLEVEIKTYLTGRENRDYQAILMSSIKVNEDQKFDASGVNAETVFKAQDYLINTLIVRIGNHTEGLSDLVLDMRSEVADKIIAEISKIADVSKKKGE